MPSPNWLLDRITNLHNGEWCAVASAINANPLHGYTCHGIGWSIPAAIRNLRHNIATSYNLVPPPEPTTEPTTSAINLLTLLGLDTTPTQTPIRRL